MITNVLLMYHVHNLLLFRIPDRTLPVWSEKLGSHPVPNTIAVHFRAGYSICLVLSVVTCKAGTVTAILAALCGKEMRWCQEHSTLDYVLNSGKEQNFSLVLSDTIQEDGTHRFGLSVEDTGSYFLPPPSTPNSSQVFSWTFFLFRVSPLSFSIPHAMFGRWMSTLLFI